VKTKTTAPTTTTAPDKTNAPTMTAAELIARLRAPKTDEEALTIMQPTDPRKSENTKYEVVDEGPALPLPQKKGLSVRIYVAAARLNKPFTAAEVAALVEGKNVAYWVRKLATLGHFKPVVTA
jgi:hypothetical protein